MNPQPDDSAAAALMPEEDASAQPETPLTAYFRLPLAPVVLTYILIALNGAIFLGQFWLGERAYDLGGMIPAQVLIVHEWWRLLTSGFLHGNLIHILSNLYALYFLGTATERLFGAPRFAGIYCASLLGSGVAITLLSEMGSVTVGASGAVLGLVGALLVYYGVYRKNLENAQESFQQMARLAILNVAIGFLPRVSLWGHVGGIAAGALMAWALLPHYSPELTPVPTLKCRPLDKRAWMRTAGASLIWVFALIAGVLWRR